MTNGNDQTHPIAENTLSGYGGLTKREYFAAMALQGICANPEFYKIASKRLIPDQMGVFYAEAATQQADLLIDELNKPTE